MNYYKSIICVNFTRQVTILVNSRQLQLLMDQQQHIMNVVTRLAEDVTHLSGEIHASDAVIRIND